MCLQVHDLQANNWDKKIPSKTNRCIAHLATEVGVLVLGNQLTQNCARLVGEGSVSLDIAAVVLSMISTGVILYKTPQWTDDYILQINRARSTTNNIISLPLRAILVGVPIDELFLQKDPEPNLEDKSLEQRKKK